jgi:uncharacterized protein involved in exopolysaccharide biosynthesis
MSVDPSPGSETKRLQLASVGAVVQDEPRLPVMRALEAVLRHRRMILLICVVAALATIGFALSQDRTYESTASFIPQSRKVPSNLASVAAQLGVSVPGDNSVPPQLYVSLLQSRELLEAMAETSFVAAGTSTGRRLADVFKVRGKTPPLRLQNTVERLRKSINAAADQKTGMVSYTVASPDPAISQQLAGALLQGVERFNAQTRKSQASAERRFSEHRLSEVGEDLRHAENRLQEFMEANAVRTVPQLQMRQQRLQRDVDLQQQLYTQLAQAYEQAKLEEVRDTPVITLVDAPNLAAKPAPRGLLTKTVAAVILAAFLGMVIAFARDGWRLSLPEAQAGADLNALWGETVADLRHPTRWLAPKTGGAPPPPALPQAMRPDDIS